MPPNVAAAVGQALEKLPADRFESAKAFAEALANPAYRGPREAVEGTSQTARPRLTLALAGVAAAALALAAWGWLRPTQTPATSMAWRVAVDLPDSIAPYAGGITISPDGASLVYSGRHESGSMLFRLDASAVDPVPIPGSEQASAADISPDGRRIAYKTRSGVMILPIGGGRARRIAQSPASNGPLEWLDNEHVLVDLASGVVSVPADGGESVQWTTRDSASGYAIHGAPASLPSGDGILVAIVPPTFDFTRSRIVAVPRPGAAPVELTRGVMSRFVSPDRLLVLRSDGDIVMFPFDPHAHRLTGPAAPVVTSIPGEVIEFAGIFDVSAAGRLIYPQGDATSDEAVMQVNARGTTAPLSSPWVGDIRAVAASPDGVRIAASVRFNGGREIEVRDAGSGASVRISEPTLSLVDPIWSADGGTLYYAAIGDERAGIYRARPGSGQVPELLVSARGLNTVRTPAPAPDGRSLYFTRVNGADDSSIERLDLTSPDAPPQVISTLSTASSPVPSPDGQWLAYVTTSAGGGTIVVQAINGADGRQWRVSIPAGVLELRWVRGGQTLYFASADSMYELPLNANGAFRPGVPTALFALGQLGMLFDVLPERRFVMVDRQAADRSGGRLLMIDDIFARRAP